MKWLCFLRGFHLTGTGELSYDLTTKVISIHCKTCQKVIDTVKDETKLTDEQWVWFLKIFEEK